MRYQLSFRKTGDWRYQLYLLRGKKLKVSHMGSQQGTLVKILDTKAQVSFCIWQYAQMHIVTHSWWEKLALSMTPLGEDNGKFHTRNSGSRLCPVYFFLWLILICLLLWQTNCEDDSFQWVLRILSVTYQMLQWSWEPLKVPLKKKSLLAAPHGMWDPSSPTRDWTHPLYIVRQILNHWTTRESLESGIDVRSEGRLL